MSLDCSCSPETVRSQREPGPSQPQDTARQCKVRSDAGILGAVRPGQPGDQVACHVQSGQTALNLYYAFSSCNPMPDKNSSYTLAKAQENVLKCTPASVRTVCTLLIVHLTMISLLIDCNYQTPGTRHPGRGLLWVIYRAGTNPCILRSHCLSGTVARTRESGPVLWRSR